jgi:hypothetical protein
VKYCDILSKLRDPHRERNAVASEPCRPARAVPALRYLQQRRLDRRFHAEPCSHHLGHLTVAPSHFVAFPQHDRERVVTSVWRCWSSGRPAPMTRIMAGIISSGLPWYTVSVCA